MKLITIKQKLLAGILLLIVLASINIFWIENPFAVIVSVLIVIVLFQITKEFNACFIEFDKRKEFHLWIKRNWLVLIPPFTIIMGMVMFVWLIIADTSLTVATVVLSVQVIIYSFFLLLILYNIFSLVYKSINGER